MSTEDFYIGSVGPLLYDPANSYPDGKPQKGFRGKAVNENGIPYATTGGGGGGGSAGEAAYPITSLYGTTTAATTPPSDAALLGFGTWSSIGSLTIGTTTVNFWIRVA